MLELGEQLIAYGWMITKLVFVIVALILGVSFLYALLSGGEK